MDIALMSPCFLCYVRIYLDVDVVPCFRLRFGEVTSVRALPDKFCAFINFKRKECAGKAMAALQVRHPSDDSHTDCVTCTDKAMTVTLTVSLVLTRQ